NFYEQKGVLPFMDILKQVDAQELIKINYQKYPALYNTKFMLAYFDYWKNLSLDDWKAILKGIGQNEIAYYGLLSFIYKYLRIDVFELFYSMKEIDDRVKKFIESGLGHGTEGLKKFVDDDWRQIEKASLTLDALDEVRLRLIKNGAN